MNVQPTTPPANGAPPEYLTQVLRQARLRIQALEDRDHTALAVIGMGCRFPSATTPLAFWQNLVAGHDAITEVPPDRWDAAALYSPTPTPGKMNTRWGGFLEQIDHFDAAFFGISGREAPAMDPQQRVLLEVAWEAIEDAGIDPRRLAGSPTGVFIGISSNDYRRLQQGTPHEVNPYAGVGNALSIAANRISYVLDLRGPSLAIDTACSSALVALHHACQSLRRGECDQALVGGVNLILDPAVTVAFSQAGMMAADGRCKAFDARADGYVRSEGAGVILLKRVSDALRDGDAIWAVLAGSAINQDGRSNGLTAPNGLAQQAVIRQALHNARVAPAQIGYVETHGTGTALGDPIEVNALKAVLLAERPADQPCWLGTVKANIGHLEAAAGMAGLLKAILCLHQEVISRQIHLQTCNPHIHLTATPLAIPLANQPWPRCTTARFAGVSSFGFGGANAHVVLTEAPSAEQPPASAGPTHHIFTLSAKSQEALRALAQQYAMLLAAQPTLPLAALCSTVNRGRAHFAQRLALVVRTTAEVQTALTAFAAGQSAPAVITGPAVPQRPRIAFLFTGQGAQLHNAGRQLYATCPSFRHTIDQCDELLRPYLAESLITLLYSDAEAEGLETGRLETGDWGTPPSKSVRLSAHAEVQNPKSKIQDTLYAQPLLFALEYALAQRWIEWGIQPDFVLGHSVGELVAACVAGAFSLEEGLWLAAMRGRLMGSLPADGAMAAVFADVATVTPSLQPMQSQASAEAQPLVAIAAINGATQTVLAGERNVLRTLLDELAAQGIESRLLPVAYAFHSPLMDPILGALEQTAGNLDYQPLQLPLVSTYTGAVLPVGHRLSAAHWRQHARETVRFTEGLDQLVAHGCQLFIEIGPQPLLSTLGQAYCQAPATHWLPSLTPPHDDWASLYHTLAQAYSQGATVAWPALYADTAHPRLRLPTYPFQRQRYWFSNEDAMQQTPRLAPVHTTTIPSGLPSAAKSRQAAMLAELRLMLANLLHLPPTAINPETRFVELGADSLVLSEAVRQIHKRYAVTIALRRFFEDLSTLNALSDYLVQQVAPDWAPAVQPAPATAQMVASTAGSANQQVPLPSSTTQQLLDIIAKQLELLTQSLLPQPTAAATSLTQATPVTPYSPNSHPPAPTAFDFAQHERNPQPTTRNPQQTPKIVPLTKAQQQLWFLSQLSDAAAMAYNESVSLWLHGPLDVARLHTALQTLVDRHEALRTRLSHTGDIQEILPTLTLDLPVVDLDSSTDVAQSDLLAAWLAGESQHLIDLATGPLFRVNLLTLGDDTHVLVMTAHHSIMDGWSMNVLLQEVSTLYATGREGQTASLPPAPQFSDYVAWQAAACQSDAMAAHEAYWLQSLRGELPLLELPLDHARPPVRSYRGALASVRLNQARTQALQHLSRQHGVTLFMTLFAAYATLLHRLSGQDELIIGIPAAGRAMPGSEQMVGYCAHLLPIRHTLVGDPSFSALLQALRTTLLTAYEHQDYPFARLLNKLNVVRDLSLAPVISSTFNLTQQPTLPPFPGLTATLGPRPTSFVDHELSVNVVEHNGELLIDFEYNRDLFEPATVARMAGHFTTLLDAIVYNPTQTVLALPLLTVTERQQLLVTWNATDLPFDTTASFQQLFEAQVARTPDAIAVLFGEEQRTYAQLNAQANAIAHHLRARGVGVDTVVAILCERSPAFVAAMLGIFKAGGAYLPLDVRAPAARQAQILAQSRTPLLLVTTDFAAAGAEALTQIDSDQLPQVQTIEALLTHSNATDNLPLLSAPIDPGARLAYVIYTSGSTGLPKGAMVEQRGMINHLYAKIRDLQLTAADTVAQTAPQSFDISVWQFLATLILGGRMRIFPDAIASDPVQLLQATADHAITILEVVPSLLRTMVDTLAQGAAPTLTTLRYMIPTGEALPPNLARQWLRACPQIPLVNAYGPTECSDDVTHYVVHTPPDEGVVNMPIGRPIINMRMYILDAHRQPVPIGVAGELYVGGVGVGRGYIHDPERTASAFVRDPFSADPHARLYKTGDKARYLADGTIEYLGRLDYQVKLRGFRIELGEIEAVLEEHPAVRQAVVMDRLDQNKNKYLVAYLTPQDAESGVEVAAVRAFVKQRLPEYMVPALFMTLATLPLTNNGKLDRKALPVPDDESWGASVAYVAPQTALQNDLVAIWADVLNLSPATIGIHHSFFELGGHSLLASQIIARLRSAFAVELPIRDLMENPTIAGMESCLHSHTPLPNLRSLNGAHQPLDAANHQHEVFDL